jgi:IclR family acetate operon transcriptional repressor/IclR family KDG regulon transcriptional repressor
MESTTVIKALGLLEALATTQRGRSLAELAVEMGLPKPTAHRLLKTLSIAGYASKADPGFYRAGPALERLTSRGGDDILREVSRPILAHLHKVTRETVNLGVLRQTEIVYLTVLESPQPLRRVVEANSTDPFYCTALGRAIVSQLPNEQRDYLLSSIRMTRRTAKTVVQRASLTAILDQARRQRYAIEIDQTDVGVTCLAAPIFDSRGVRAALSLSVPSPRMTGEHTDRWLALVLSSAAKISRLLKAAATRTSRE